MLRQTELKRTAFMTFGNLGIPAALVAVVELLEAFFSAEVRSALMLLVV